MPKAILTAMVIAKGTGQVPTRLEWDTQDTQGALATPEAPEETPHRISVDLLRE
jgi:hypothetical protein